MYMRHCVVHVNYMQYHDIHQSINQVIHVTWNHNPNTVMDYNIIIACNVTMQQHRNCTCQEFLLYSMYVVKCYLYSVIGKLSKSIPAVSSKGRGYMKFAC